MSDNVTTALKYAAVAAPFVAVFASRYGIDSQTVVDTITGLCMIYLAWRPSAKELFIKK